MDRRTVTRVRRALLRIGLLTLAASAQPASAFDPDFHFEATYLAARAAGLERTPAVEAARAAWAVDSRHAGALSTVRPVLRSAAMAVVLPTLVWPAAFAVVGRYDSALDWFGKLSDFVVHPAAVAIHFPTLPGAERVAPYRGRPEHAAGRLVAFALDAGDPRLLGIALHSAQDSYSHSGLLPASHLGRYHLLDSLETPVSRNRARLALRRTYLVAAHYARSRGTYAGEAQWLRLRDAFEPWLRSIGDDEPDYAALRRAYLGEGDAPDAEPARPARFAAAREAVLREVSSW